MLDYTGSDCLERVLAYRKEAIWAGERLGKGIGEAYLFSVLTECPSLLSNGRCLREVLGEDISSWPLIKYIDAFGELSVQVHPSFAQGKSGKDEIWFIDHVYEGGEVRIGFFHDVTAEEVRCCCQNGTILSLMKKVSVAPGDVLLIPGGTVHSVRGVSFWEVQHSMDVTYRLFDYGRSRLLQLEEGLLELEYRALPLKRSKVNLVGRDFFAGLPFYVTLQNHDDVLFQSRMSDSIIVVADGKGFCDNGIFCKNDCFLVHEGERIRWQGKGKFFLIFSKTCENS